MNKQNRQLRDYQAQALTTVQDRAMDLDYLVPAIVGEVGELFGQRAKAHWQNWDEERIAEELVLEYGDVAWMTAVLLHKYEAGELGADVWMSANNRWSDKIEPWMALLSRAESLYLYYSEGEEQYLEHAAKRLWSVLEYRAEAITGKPFQASLDANLAKLAARAERGTLQTHARGGE